MLLVKLPVPVPLVVWLLLMVGLCPHRKERAHLVVAGARILGTGVPGRHGQQVLHRQTLQLRGGLGRHQVREEVLDLVAHFPISSNSSCSNALAAYKKQVAISGIYYRFFVNAF